MAYFTDLFSPHTYEAFSRSDRTVSGLRERHTNAAGRVNVGEKLLCYVTRLSRWVGMLEVLDDSYVNSTPIFAETNDPFIIRFRVRPHFWLSIDQSLPIRERHVWMALSFTRDHPRNG